MDTLMDKLCFESIKKHYLARLPLLKAHCDANQFRANLGYYARSPGLGGGCSYGPKVSDCGSRGCPGQASYLRRSLWHSSQNYRTS